MREADLGRWLEWQGQREAVEQEADVPTGFGTAHEQQSAAVGGRHGDVEQLDGGEFLQNHPGNQAGASPRSCWRRLIARQKVWNTTNRWASMRSAM